MSELAQLLGTSFANTQLERASASVPMARYSQLGGWWLHAANLEQWIAEEGQDSPNGRIFLTGQGWAQISLEDMPGWHPVASLAGPPEGKRIQLTTRYGFKDGSVLESSMQMDFDPSLGRYLGLGPISDGTLVNGALRSRILVQTLEASPLEIHDLVFGWVRLGDDV